jgi:site-specific recombinase XerD
MAELIQDLFASFTRDLKAGGKSDRTVKVYRDAVLSFERWLVAAGRPVTADSLTKHAVSSWLADSGEKLAENTVLTYFRGMRRFVRWLLAEGEITDDAMKNLQQPNPPVKPVPIITDSDISKLFKSCEGRSFVARRDEAILRMLFDCGLRISEIANVKVEDVDMHADLVYVMGKGRRPRAVPFSSKTARALDRYIRIRRQHKYAGCDGFWLGQRGPYKADGIDNIIRVRAEKTGVEGLHAHRFRHTFAHDWLANGGQERDLMRLAGWSSDAMLDRYGASAATERAHNAARKLKRGDRL